MAITTLTLTLLIILALILRETIAGLVRFHNVEKRVTDLEKANVQRLPHKSFEELLNAMAALDKEIEERKFQTSLLENAAGHITNAMAAGTKREK